MAFRRQDIPKTTRKVEDGGPRRLYPRFIRDRSLLPKVDLAIGYLDGMVGRKRGDLSSDIVLELFGDPKLARCMLTCLADSYRYRTPDIAEIVGDEAAVSLAAWNLLTPADLRAHVYLAANGQRGGFVGDAERPSFLAEIAGPLGITGPELDNLLHLDAERNARLVRVGPRPQSEDIVARYNTLLVLSVLRHASEISLELPGLDASALETLCARHEVPYRRTGAEAVRLAGRRNAVGSWSGFGGRLARCATQLMTLSPQAPAGQATIHLGEQTFTFFLDAKVVAALRPKLRAVAACDGVLRAAVLAEEIAAMRRKGADAFNGWTVRRPVEPLIVDGALVLPELAFCRGQISVAVVPVPGGTGRASALAALELAHRTRPVIALNVPDGLAQVPALPVASAPALLDLVERVAVGLDHSPTPLGVVAEELTANGWVSTSRLSEVLGQGDDLPVRVHTLTAEGEVAFVPGFGLCRVTLLDELIDRLAIGPLDIAGFRADVAARVGDDLAADALTLHLLSRHTLLAQSDAFALARPVQHAA
ncbi:MAG: DUF790 family protein [Chloroflexota bacterium]|nr:DUF790 family protein [Chloroflexota bacterium]